MTGPADPDTGFGDEPARGSVAPDFSLRNQHGETVTLHRLRGTPLLLVFFPYAFSGVCTQELTDLRDAMGEVTAAGGRVLGVSTDTVYALRTFADQLGLGFDLLSDFWPHGEVARRYGVFDADLGCAVRGSFVLDAEGRVHAALTEEMDRPRDIAEHVQALREAVDH